MEKEILNLEKKRKTISKVKHIRMIIIISIVICGVVGAVMQIRNTETEKELRDNLQNAEQFLSKRDYDTAMQEYQTAFKIDSSDGQVVAFGEKLYLVLSTEKELDGNLDDAISILEKATEELQTAQENSVINTKLEALRQLKEEVQDPDLGEMTEQLIQIVNEWQYYHDMATSEEKDEIFSAYADAFLNYIVLYESVYGTEECTCGQLYIDSTATLNEKDFFDLGTAYDFAIYFRLATDSEDMAWIIRCAQAEKSGVTEFLNGFSVECNTGYVETRKSASGRWPVNRTIQYRDMEGNVYSVKHNNSYIEGTQTYDKYGREISIDSVGYDEREYHKDYVYGISSEPILDQLKIEGQDFRVIQDISSEKNVRMDNLLLSFAITEFNTKKDVYSEEHGNIKLLYVFRDGSVYCAKEYFDDYYDRDDCSERYYLRDADEKWIHLEDWVYLGSFSSEELEVILKEADAIDENAASADYQYTWPLFANRREPEITWYSSPKVDMYKFKKLGDAINILNCISVCVYKNGTSYELWKTKESQYISSVISQLSVDENALNLIYDIMDSDYYEQWEPVSLLTQKRQPVTEWVASSSGVSPLSTRRVLDGELYRTVIVVR